MAVGEMRVLLIQQSSIGSELNYALAAACRVCGSRVETLLFAILELFHSGEHPNSAAIDITAPVSSASSCNDLQN
jgi:hypothetical protein